QPVTYVHGRVLDTADRPLAGTQVTVSQETDNQALASLTTDATGEFLVVLPAGQNYRLEATKTGFLFYSDRFELTGEFPREEPYELAIGLQAVPTAGITVGDQATPIVLRNVRFATGSAELLPASIPELDQLVLLLQTYPQLRIRINGHTDNVGEAAANQALSEARARSVYTYLTAKGIAAARLRYQGFGESRPLADNTTEEGRARNRRTEFEVE
ncbi:MAG: flagellar motor protein MotB, partial [Bacteroidetes bacterium]